MVSNLKPAGKECSVVTASSSFRVINNEGVTVVKKVHQLHVVGYSK